MSADVLSPMSPEDNITKNLDLIEVKFKWIKDDLRKGLDFHKRYPNMNQQLEYILNTVIPRCLYQGTEVETLYCTNCNELLRKRQDLEQANLELKRLEESESKRSVEITHGVVNHIRKIHGHKYKDEADKDILATKYSQLFKSTFDPLYYTLEKTTFNLSEDESSFVVNRMFQILYTKCTELMISKMTKQLEKLFVLQGELEGVEKERMTDTQYAFGLLLHAANIKEYKMIDDIDETMTILRGNIFIRSVFEKMENQKLQLLIKKVVENIQSFLTLVPPMVVDCSLHPDLESGAYSPKEVAGSTLEQCVTTQSALFYSYQGEAVASCGECAFIAIRKDIPEEFFTEEYPHTYLQKSSLLGNEFTHPLQNAPEDSQGEEKLGISQSEDQKNTIHFQKQNVTQTEINLELMQEMKQIIEESNQRQLQKIGELTAGQKEELLRYLQQYNQELHKLTEINHEMYSTIQVQDEEIRHLQTVSLTENPQWVIENEEIQIQKPTKVIDKLRKGWGEVKVGVFRGTVVAVMCLNELLRTQYNLSLPSREMDIAARVRHPNLLQFIGATRVGNPMILTELMLTNLRIEMDKKSYLFRSQIVGISRNIASALNYLHLWKPEPILHRDVASCKVLLEPSGGNQWKAKLSDYGSAHLQYQISSVLGPGNPAYAAPEFHYPDYHSPAMDVYSFGVLLLEMVVHHPHPPPTSERMNLFLAALWPSMKTIIQRCTMEDINQRPTMSHILQFLENPV